MILGHWYLVIPSMQVSHLQSIVECTSRRWSSGSSWSQSRSGIAIATWLPDSGPSFRHYIFSVDGIFFWQRVLFGLAGPAVLSYLTWETAKIRSTQSATGILYVDFFTVVVGEVLAKYIAPRDACAGVVKSRVVGCTAVRNLCNFSLRTASGPEGSSAHQILTCAAGTSGPRFSPQSTV